MTMAHRELARRLLAFTLISIAVAPLYGATFTVNSNADAADASPGDGTCDAGAGVCTLRAAIQEANAFPGVDTIQFAIGSGPQTIAPASALPAFAEGLILDGTTQPGYGGTPLIELDGINAGNSDGLNIPGSASSTIRGLLINRFQMCGIALGTSNSTIESCYIGTDATRTLNRGNGQDGIRVYAGSGNTIRYNVLAFNGNNGVMILDGSNYSYPLFTALTPDQTFIFPTIDFNDNCGNFAHASTGLITDTLGRGFNENFGMRLTGTMSVVSAGSYTFDFPQHDDQVRLVIDGTERLNFSGPGTASATVSLSAGDHSFEVDFWEGGGAASIQMSASGPSTPTFTSAGNPGLAGELFQGSIPAINNTISQNSTFNNTWQGIALSCCCRDMNDGADIDYGANTFLNYPVITGHVVNMNGSITVNGTAPVGSIVEIFGSTNDIGNPGQGYGEGKFYAATSAIVGGDGLFSVTFNLPSEYNSVTATATDSSGNTSEFSGNRYVRLHQIIVTNLNDSGTGSLRDAIVEANGDGVDTNIGFDPQLSGGTITLSSPLPALTENGTMINGDINADCRPDIEINGNFAASTCLTIASANNKIRGIAVNRCSTEVLAIQNAPATDNQVLCTYIGTNLGGTNTLGSSPYGVQIRNGASNNRIAENNIIAAFGIAAVRITGGSNNTVGGTKIGLDVTGTVTMPSPIGIQLDNTSGNYVGEPNNGNRIVALNGAVDVSGGSNLRVYGNTIGWPDGWPSPTGYGIRLHDGASSATIGGTAPGEANVIRNNGGDGIRIEGGDSDFNAIHANSISGNGGLGIDIDAAGVTPNDANDTDSGANEGQNFPVLTRATSNGVTTQVEGFLDAPVVPGNYTLDFYGSPTPDATGYGEGATHLGAFGTPPGTFSFSIPAAAVGSYVTATATAVTTGNTSEFSLALEVTGPPLGATELVAYPVAPTSIALKWRDPNAGETGFRIERRFENMTFAQLTNVGPDVTTYTDTQVASGQQVWYRVTATSAAGNAPPSNVATARAFHNFAQQTCRATQSMYHNLAEWVTASWNGTNWAIAWADTRNGRAADIYFQLLNAGDGSPIGSPLQITNDDTPSSMPSLTFNGSNFGLTWFDHVRGPNGEPLRILSFALLDSAGNKLRGDMKLTTSTVPFTTQPDGTTSLVWDGGGWGIVLAQTASSALADVVYYRLDPDGDPLVNALALTGTTLSNETGISAAWNGSEYGLSWVQESAGSFTIMFQRIQPNGTLVGAPVLVAGIPVGNAATNTVWDGTGWAVAWHETTNTGTWTVYMARLAANGTIVSGPAQISDAVDGYDYFPKLFVKPGGGYVIFTESVLTSGGIEIGRLEADANGARVGSRIVVTPDDGFVSDFPRAAGNGTNFVVAFRESSGNSSEVASVVVSGAGVAGPVNAVTTSHPAPSGSTAPTTIAMSNQFVSLWPELSPSGINQLHGRIVRSNGTFVNLYPLNGANPFQRRVASVAYGNRFAVAWTDLSTGGVHLQRFDDAGASIGGPLLVASPVATARGAGLAYSGEHFGVVWVQSSQLKFQRVDESGTLVGSPTSINMTAQNEPQIQWIGSGWVIVFRANSNLYFTRLDAAGAIIVPPTQITDSFANPPDFQLLWTGEQIALTWAEYRGITQNYDIFFTLLDANGFKQFTPVLVAGSQYSDRWPAMYFDGTDFRIVYPDVLGGMRDVGVSVSGTLLPSPRFYGNHGEGRPSVAFNGGTLGIAWLHQSDILFQTTACLADVSAPPCTTLNGGFSAGAVQLTWPAGNDPQSGILAYHLYRDGSLLTELLPTTLAFTDRGFTPGAVHNYELRPYNGAHLEATGCTPRAVTAGILVLPGTLPNAKQSNNYNQNFTASQGTGPYTFNVTTGSLPAGLSLNSGNGNLSGQPTTVGLSNFTITATDTLSATGSRAYSLRVCPNTFMMPTVLPDPIVNSPYSQTITVTNASGPFTAAITSGALPAGLALSPSGTISGTPTAMGPFSFTITSTEPFGCQTSQAYSFTVQSGQAPRNPTATAQSSSSILVKWDRPVRGETGFRIERSTDATTWTAINNVGSDVNSVLDSGLTATTLYYYRVVAFSGSTDAGTSSLAAAMTFPLGPTKVCQTVVGPYHSRAQMMSVTHDGTRWAAAWQDRKDNLLEEIYFQFLDNATGTPAGSPVRVTSTDMLTRFPMVRWNGTNFGILYSENMRGPAGELTSTTSFAILDASGNVVRAGVPVFTTTGGTLNGNLDLPFTWDGGGWGVFAAEARGNPPADVYYWRLSPSGDIVTGPVRLTTGTQWELDINPLWNGAEYGVAWIERTSSTDTLQFQRMQADGTLVGSPVTLDSSTTERFGVPNLTWNGSEWAIAWNVEASDTFIRLRRLNPDGSPKAPAVRISDDPSGNPSTPIDDEIPLVYPKSGGGYLVYTLSRIYPSNAYEVARLEADATGARVGSRVYLTPDDGVGSNVIRASTDGTRVMVAYDNLGTGQNEAANIIVNAAGSVTNGPTAVTAGHSAGNSNTFVLVPVGAGFAAIWNESPSSQLRAKIYDGGGNLSATKTPLSPSTGVRSRVGAVGVGNTFAVAWRDSANIRFCRFDSAGNAVISEAVLPTGGNVPGLAWNGEQYGLVFQEGSFLRFQRLNADGTLSGPKINVGDASGGLNPQIAWVGSGWAIVWRLNTELYFALLDRNGAFVVPPIRVTFTATQETSLQIAWSGDRLGVVWTEARDGAVATDLWFTALKLDGTKAFAEKALVATPYGEFGPAIYWSGDRFRIVYANGSGATKEIAVQTDGTIVGSERVWHNRQLGMTIAWNGVTLGMLYTGLFDLTLQSSACFDDVTAPPCPNTSTNFNGQRVRISWPFVADAESGILAYNVYRDGVHLAELAPATGLYDDKGFVSGATHVYEVRALNAALRESTGCTTRTVVAGVSVIPATLPNGNVGTNYNQMVSGAQGTAPYTFAVTAGSLPGGLTLNTATGQISGTPTSAGLFSFTITATDATTATGSRAYTIRICSGITVYPTILLDGYVSSPYSQTIVTTGNVGSVALLVTGGTLPAGLTLDATGWLHGTPTATGSSTFTITATDSIGCSAARAYTLNVLSGTAVRNLSAQATGTATVRLRWSDPQRNENGFRIERSTDLGATYAPLTIVGPDVTTFTNAGLTAGTPYTYRVVATSPAGDASASNVATAATFPATAAKTCIQQISPYHAAARSPSVVWNGSQWAMAYQDRTGGDDEEIYFTFLTATGAMTGTPLRLTNNDSNSLRPTIRWNGTNFGVMWLEQVRGASGEFVNGYRFALVSGSGVLLRTDVRITAPNEFSSSSGDQHFFWDGSGWGMFDSRFTSDGFSEIFFHRFDEDGDMLAGPLRLTNDPLGDTGVIVAWNGAEYGIVWLRFDGSNTSIMFQRVSAAGVMLGSPAVITTDPNDAFAGVDVVSTASGWAVAWGIATDTEDVVYLRRLDATGVFVGGATRLSDDFDLNGFTPADQRPVSDIFPDLFALPGGGFGVFTRAFLNATGRQEVGFLRADASGARVGARVVVSPQDTWNSGNAKGAFNGTNFLLAWNESRLGTQELASAVVNQSGGAVSGPTDLTSGHSPGNGIGFITSQQPSIAPVGGGFAALWSEPAAATENRVYAKIYGGTGAVAATKTPLSTRNTRGRPGVVGVGSTFAAAWKDTSNNVVFGRWDASGNALFTESNIATGAGGFANVVVGFDGETYGVLWQQGGRLNFQRVAANGTNLGARATLSPAVTTVTQQMVWTGSGWAIAFVADSDVWFALVDINGAVVTAPIRVTFTPTIPKESLAIAWSGDAVGIAFQVMPPIEPPGRVPAFTVVDLNGIKQFTEVTFSEGRFDNTLQAINWDTDHFRIAFVPGESGTLREQDVSTTGSLLGASRMLANRSGSAAVVWNGTTAAASSLQLGELFFETTACLADATAPPCPSAGASRSTGPVTVTWTGVTDAESGIYRYEIFRDGLMIAEANGTSTSFLDAGVRGSDNHNYRVVAVNGAFRESAGCSTFVPVVVPSGLAAIATSATAVQVTWSAAAGATSYTVERTADNTTWTSVGTTAGTALSDGSASAGTSYLYRVRVATPSVSQPSNADLATTILFTDDPLTVGTTVKALHLSQIRTAVAAVRTLAGLTSSWTDSAVAGTSIRAVHVNELRTGLDQARSALALPPLTYTDTLTPAVLVRASHTQEVRNGVK